MPLFQYYYAYKPFQVLCQFSPEGDKKTLKDIFHVPTDVYPVGRLDYDSEGLIILTNNPAINKQLLDPSNAHIRTYWVQVEGAMSKEALNQLTKGVIISVNGKTYKTHPATVALLTQSPTVPERTPPIRYRKNIPTSWIALTITEGKNRQVRKMTAAVGYPTLRLIRYSIEDINIEKLTPGALIPINEATLKKAIFHKKDKKSPFPR